MLEIVTVMVERLVQMIVDSGKSLESRQKNRKEVCPLRRRRVATIFYISLSRM
jgi:hypothetical protein